MAVHLLCLNWNMNGHKWFLYRKPINHFKSINFPHSVTEIMLIDRSMKNKDVKNGDLFVSCCSAYDAD